MNIHELDAVKQIVNLLQQFENNTGILYVRECVLVDEADDVICYVRSADDGSLYVSTTEE